MGLSRLAGIVLLTNKKPPAFVAGGSWRFMACWRQLKQAAFLSSSLALAAHLQAVALSSP